LKWSTPQGYPGWKPEPARAIVRKAQTVHLAVIGRTPEPVAHARRAVRQAFCAIADSQLPLFHSHFQRRQAMLTTWMNSVELKGFASTS